MKYLILLFFAMMILSVGGKSDALAGGVTVGNGGDSVAQEFTLVAQEIVKYFSYLESKDFSPLQIDTFKNTVQKTRVETKDVLILNGAEVDAINYPTQSRIEVSRNRWNTATGDRKQHLLLVLHEYLWMAGIDDTGYRVSNSLYPQILSARKSFLSKPGIMKCLAFVYRARDLAQGNANAKVTSNMIEIKIGKDAITEGSAVINGETVNASIFKNANADVYNLTLQLGTPAVATISDLLINDGPAGEWDIHPGIRYSFSQNQNGFLSLTQNFIKALQNANKWTTPPYNRSAILGADTAGAMTDDIKEFLKNGQLKPGDIVGLSSWISCTLTK